MKENMSSSVGQAKLSLDGTKSHNTVSLDNFQFN